MSARGNGNAPMLHEALFKTHSIFTPEIQVGQADWPKSLKNKWAQ